MSTDIAQIKAEIKEWQRAHRKIHGRDPGKEELKKNPEMQAKYKIWQASIKAEKEAAAKPTTTTPPQRTGLPKKTLPSQPKQTAPATPFSARKLRPEVSLTSSSSQPKIANPFSQSPAKGPRAPDFSVASSSKSTRTIPFNSTSSARHRPFPMLDSDSDQDNDEDDNPFAPTSPTRSRRASQLVTPSKSALRRKSSTALSSPTRPNQSPTRSRLATLTPRTKARKRMRGEEVPTTPGDKRRKLVPLSQPDTIPPIQFGLGLGTSNLSESRGTKRPSSDVDEDEDEIMDSPRKKSAVASNGRVYTSIFDESPRKVAFALSEDDDDDDAGMRSTPPPPPSSDAVSPPEDNDSATPPPMRSASSSLKSTKPLNPIVQMTNDTWDAPVAGTDLSHLRKGQLGKKPVPTKAKAKDKAKEKEKEAAQERVANPFELLPPMPNDEPPPKKNWSGAKKEWKDGGKQDWKDGAGKKDGEKKAEWKSAAEMKKRAKELAAEVEANQGESSDVDVEVQEIEWKPHGPLRATSIGPLSQQSQHDEDLGEGDHDIAQDLPSDLRTFLSIHPSKRDKIDKDTLARDILAGRARPGAGIEVWGVGWEEGEEDEEGEGDWDSEPEGWTGGVEM
ncbi:DNA replication and checkpoint protein [Ceratobasidium sp. AG-Ba]|nr:DNA replication and checkpoint protein [Ceratobasidium sp. AG-Ba]